MPAKNPPPSDSSPLKRSTFWILAAVTILLTLNWVAAVARFQVNVPIWDQWDFFNPLFNGEGLFELFHYQHGPHRQGVAFIFSSWIMAASHWDSRIESLWMVCILATTAVLALGLKKRLTGRLGLADTCIPLLILTLGQWGSVISVPNASHSVFPLLLIVLSAHCWIDSRPSIRLPAAGVLAALSIFTGFGIFNGIVLTALLTVALLRAVLRRQKTEIGWASLGMVISMLGWIFFLRGYQFNPASDGYHFPHTPLFDYARFLALMLVHPAGADHDTTFCQFAGGVLLTACLAIFSLSIVGCFHNDTRSRYYQTIVLLLGSGTAFAAFTAVGRIHLGLSAGMASRYVTLLIPLWLGLYFWGASQAQPAVKYGTTLCFSLVALLPFTQLSKRPFANWPGTVGLTNASLSALANSTNEKMAWVSAYLHSDDFKQADRAAGRLIHPAGESIGLDRKLAWLKNRHLSFFKSSASSDSWQPWWPENRCTWLRTHASEGDQCWMSDDCTLWLFAKHEGFVNFRVIQSAASLPPDAHLEITHRQITASESSEFLRETISFPITKGEHLLTLRSTAGSFPARPPFDNRLISYRLTNPSITSQPAGVEWIPSTTSEKLSTWAPRYRWRIVSGFHGWEYPAAFGWSDALLKIEIQSTVPTYLNVRIEKRYPPVSSGPVILLIDDWRIEIPDPENHPAFSLPVPASSPPCLVQIENSAGAVSPHTSEGKADKRPLALKFRELNVSTKAQFPVYRATSPAPTAATSKSARSLP